MRSNATQVMFPDANRDHQARQSLTQSLRAHATRKFSEGYQAPYRDTIMGEFSTLKLGQGDERAVRRFGVILACQ